MFTSPGTRAGRGESLGFWSKLFDRLFGSTVGNVIVRKSAGWRGGTVSDVSPLTTKGDLFVYGSGNTRLPVGTNGKIAFADSTNSLGLAYHNRATLRYGWQAAEDFLRVANNLSNYAAADPTFLTYFTSTGTGSGQGTAAIEYGHPGIISIGFGTSSGTGTAQLQYGINSATGGNGAIELDNGGGSDQVWYFKTDSTLSNGTTRYSIQGGYFDGQSSTPNRAIFQYTDNVNSGAFSLLVTSNSVNQTRVDGTTTVLASTWYRMRLNINAAYTAITLYISVGTVSGGVTTWGAEYQDCQYTGTMPQNTVKYYGVLKIAKTVGTGNPPLLVDGWEAAMYLASPRGG